MRSETDLVQALVPALEFVLPKSIVFKHKDGATAGIPDISISWKRTQWLEVKATEKADRIEHHKYWGLQLLTCRRLEHVSRNCLFVIYFKVNGVQSTSVYLPHWLSDKCEITGVPEAAFPGYDHHGVAQFLKERINRDHQRT